MPSPSHQDLPSLRAVVRVRASVENTTWWDAKFYPYSPPWADPVFAVAGGRNALVYRCLPTKETVEILCELEDEDPNEEYNSIDWSCTANGDPLLCVAGSGRQIKVYNVKEKRLTLSGHGDNISDLAVSPADHSIMASASEDCSIRLWSLDQAHQEQPTAGIAFGEGHKESILALGFHRKGQYLLSGGRDTRVNLWLIPSDLKENLGTDKPKVMHYPLFQSEEVHKDFIDCVRFHNDVIISRAANEHTILLWRIEGFDSENPPPTSFPMPYSQTVHSDKAVIAPASFRTRSAWGGRFQRLLQFDLPDSGAQYIRFGLFHELGKHPILSAGNHRSEVFFWDLERLEEYGVSGAQVKGEAKETTAFRMQTAPSALPPDLVTRFREGSEASSTSSASGAHSTTSGGPRGGVPRRSRSVKAKDAKVVGIGNPLKPIKPHKKVIYVTPNVEYTPRQITFSRGGDWCVATGENGVIVIMSRWEDGWPETPGLAPLEAAYEAELNRCRKLKLFDVGLTTQQDVVKAKQVVDAKVATARTAARDNNDTKQLEFLARDFPDE